MPASQNQKGTVNKTETITEIAKEVLGMQTLEPQRRDRLDFHDLSVSSIKAALEKAYEAGRESPSKLR